MFNVKDRVTSSFTGQGVVIDVGDELVLVNFDGVLGERWWSSIRLMLVEAPPPIVKTLRHVTKTDTQCQFNCWDARNDVCACSCAGVNHGIANDPTRVIEYHLLLLGDAQ